MSPQFLEPPFRIRVGRYARVFVFVRSHAQCAYLRTRGYSCHPLGKFIMSKPNRHQRALEQS